MNEKLLERAEDCLRRFVENGGTLTDEVKEDIRVRLLALMREDNTERIEHDNK